jgi:hypothetical protein
MYNTNIGTFCAEHEDYLELLAAEPYYIKIKEDEPYIIFNYDQLRSDFNNPIVQEARGIIFKKGQWENPVCWAFNKFGNYGEGWVKDIDWDTAFVSEKVDGSLMKVWWDNEWKISTNGTVDAFKADLGDVRMPNFGEYFIDTLLDYYNNSTEFYNTLDEDKTYMFELVGPYNRVVVPYEQSDLYFLGARNKYTGEEFNCSPLTAGALNMGLFKLPKQYPFNTLEHCIKITENFPWDAEGVVACDAQFNRVKIKSPAYVMAHFARNNNVINRKHLINIILTNEVEEFLCYAADYKEELEKVQGLMKAYCKVGDQIAKSCQRLYDIPKKTYAYWVQTLPKIYQDLAFRNYNNIMSTKDYTASWNENKWDTYLDSFEELMRDLYIKE